MLLEDAERVTKTLPDRLPALQLRLEAYLGGAAIHLRTACEVWFGDLRKVPDQSLMWFVTLARHVSAHAKVAPLQTATKAIEFRWNNALNEGQLIIDVLTSIDFVGSDASLQEKDQANRFLSKHDGDVFKALHSATGTIGSWVGKELDNDFRMLIQTPVGRPRLRIRLREPAEFSRLVNAFTKNEDALLGDERSVEIVAPVSANGDF